MFNHLRNWISAWEHSRYSSFEMKYLHRAICEAFSDKFNTILKANNLNAFYLVENFEWKLCDPFGQSSGYAKP